MHECFYIQCVELLQEPREPCTLYRIYSLYLVYHVVAAGVAAIAYILSEFFTLALASRLEASVSRCEDAAKGL